MGVTATDELLSSLSSSLSLETMIAAAYAIIPLQTCMLTTPNLNCVYVIIPLQTCMLTTSNLNCVYVIILSHTTIIGWHDTPPVLICNNIMHKQNILCMFNKI